LNVTKKSAMTMALASKIKYEANFMSPNEQVSYSMYCTLCDSLTVLCAPVLTLVLLKGINYLYLLLVFYVYSQSPTYDPEVSFCDAGNKKIKLTKK
jgi:hypothetical protein